MEERIKLSRAYIAATLAMVAIGIVALVTGFLQDSQRAWANYLLNNVYFISLAVGAVLFLSIQRVTHSGWSAGFIRVPEAMGAYIPVAAILFLAAQEANAASGAMLLLAYALGIGIPFIAAAVFFRPFMDSMKRLRKHMGLVEKVTGGLLVLTGILFITGAMSWLSYLMLEWFPGLGTIG